MNDLAEPKGYFLHDRGICESANVGEGTRIWAFAHVLPGAVIGRDCNICDQSSSRTTSSLATGSR